MFIDTLSNGVRVVIDPIDKTSTTTVMIAVNVGSRDETKEINGICHYLEHMAFKGTSDKSADEVNDYIADIGGNVNAYTSYERTVYHLSCLSEHTNSAIDILSEIVLDSSLPEKEMEKEREVIVQEIHMYDDRPDSISYQGGRFALFGDNPLGWDIIGTADNVRNITQNTLYGFYKSNYTPDRITISVAGN
ncbi:MAG: pitrilysin family protein, partial [Candidimonas sp.]